MTAQRGVAALVGIGLDSTQLAGAPDAQYLANPERWIFFDIANPASKYQINGSGTFQALGSGGSGSALALARSGQGSPVIPASGNGSINASKYARTKAAAAAVLAGTGYLNIMPVGDSTFVGAYALGSGTPAAGNRPFSLSAYLATALTGAGFPVLDSAWVGDGDVAAVWTSTLAAYDPRVTLPGGLAASATFATMGGRCILCPTGAAASAFLTFLPFEACDTFDVYYATSPTAGIFTISRTGDVASGNISTVAANGVGKVTFSGALGSANAVTLNHVSGNVYILAIVGYDSNTKSVRLFNCGYSTATVGQLFDNSSGYAPLPGYLAIGASAPTLALVGGMVNNWNTAVSVAQSQSDLDAGVLALLNAGIDVALVTPFPSATSVAALALQKQYVQAQYTVAGKYGLAINDFWARVGSYEREMATYGDYANTLHPAKALYQQAASSHSQFIAALLAA